MRRALTTRALGAALALACGGEPAEPPPNLLLVSVDTLRADALACYGGTAGAELCALFEPGLRYRWAFAPASHTAPSMATMLTSLSPPQHGLSERLRTRLDDSVTTLAERLRDAGYDTAAVVSNPMLHPRRGLDRGFAHYDARMTRREPHRPGFAEREARATTDAALAWARRRAREPWFLWVHYQDPHGPYLPPGAPEREDPPGSEPLPRLADHGGLGGIPAYQALPGLRTLPAYAAAYRGEIEHAARHVARLVRELDARGRPPALLLTADHGEAFGEDGYYFAHGHSVALEQVRVPLLLRAPGLARSAVVDHPVGLVDVVPTLLALAGRPPAGLGQPLPEAGLGGDRSPRLLVAEHRGHAALVWGRRFYSRALGPEAEAPLPPRTTELGDDDAPPRSHPGAARRLDALLEQGLQEARRRSGPGADPPPALGYVE